MFEGFNDLPADHWQSEEIVRFGEKIRARLHVWWNAEPDRKLAYTVPTYYGRRPMHEILERTAWHAAQHARQIMLMLESHGTVPGLPLTADDLAGLPVPDEVWDR